MNNEIESYSSAVSVDVGFSQISTTWTRISNMQQSASILLTILTFIITLLFTYLTTSEFPGYSEYEKLYILVLIAIAIVFAGVSFTFLVKILIPKKVSNIINASAYHSLILKKLNNVLTYGKQYSLDEIESIINKITLEIISEFDTNMEKIINNNQMNYSYCLNSSLVSFLSSFLTIFFVLMKIFSISFSKNAVFIIFMLSITGIFMFCIRFVINNIKE